MKLQVGLALIAGLWFAAVGCNRSTEYEALLKRERTSGIRYDSLFLGYALGMPKDAFYSHSRDLNRKGLVMQGPQNQTVQYELPDALRYPARMNYYPDFFEDRVYRMRVTFAYNSWAPWTKWLSSDSLKVDVVRLLEAWYGTGFFPHGSITRSTKTEVPMIKVEGNRHIEVAAVTDMEVAVVITDMVAAMASELSDD